MIRLICIQTYHGHWAGHSGYHPFLGRMPGDFRVTHQRIPRQAVGWPELRGPEKLWFKPAALVASRWAGPWATQNDLLTEVRLLQQVREALRSKDKVIVHFLDGEVGFNFFGGLRRLLGQDGKRLRLAATYHQPISWLERVVPHRDRLRALDLVLTVGTSQLSFFDFLPRERVRFIPHGADTGYFHPKGFPDVAGRLYCVTVGQWLRDFDALEKVIQLAPPNMVFRIVAVKESLERFRGLPNVELHSGIEDDALRRIYRESHVGLLPLQDSTANNTLLEMMACGLPIVTTRVGSVEDYISGDACVMLPENRPEEILRVLKTLGQSPEERKRFGAVARERSLEFSWPKIADRMAEVYREV